LTVDASQDLVRQGGRLRGFTTQLLQRRPHRAVDDTGDQHPCGEVVDPLEVLPQLRRDVASRPPGEGERHQLPPVRGQGARAHSLLSEVPEEPVAFVGRRGMFGGEVPVSDPDLIEPTLKFVALLPRVLFGLMKHRKTVLGLPFARLVARFRLAHRGFKPETVVDHRVEISLRRRVRGLQLPDGGVALLDRGQQPIPFRRVLGGDEILPVLHGHRLEPLQDTLPLGRPFRRQLLMPFGELLERRLALLAIGERLPARGFGNGARRRGFVQFAIASLEIRLVARLERVDRSFELAQDLFALDHRDLELAPP